MEEAEDREVQQTPQPAQTPEPETIEGLVFVANPDYPYPFKVAKPPRFWMEEQTGALEQAVETYMAGEKLSPAELSAIKIYLKQFVERATLTGDVDRRRLLQRIDKLKNTNAVEELADEIAEFGAEVF